MSSASQSDDSIAATTREAAETAGTYLRARFLEADPVVSSKSDSSIQTNHDLAADTIIRQIIETRFPADRIFSEEDGTDTPTFSASGANTWYVDPLDGTDNFVTGIPLFTSVVGVYGPNGKALAAAINIPFYDQTVSVDDTGNVHGIPLRQSYLGSQVLRDARVALIPSYHNRATLPVNELRHVLYNSCKRLVDTWCPSLDWVLLTVGKIDAVVVCSDGHADFDIRIGRLIFESSTSAANHVVVLPRASRGFDIIVAVAHPGLIGPLTRLVSRSL